MAATHVYGSWLKNSSYASSEFSKYKSPHQISNERVINEFLKEEFHCETLVPFPQFHCRIIAKRASFSFKMTSISQYYEL